MSLPSLQDFIRDSAPQLPAWHWAVLGGLAVAVMVFARVRGRRSVYGAVALAAAVVLGLCLLDALALVRLGYVALAAFLLSLCIETLQLSLHIGMFEVTDLLLNTAGALLGAALSLGLRRMVVGKIDPDAGL